jgi:hypothetical protein
MEEWEERTVSRSRAFHGKTRYRSAGKNSARYRYNVRFEIPNYHGHLPVPGRCPMWNHLRAGLVLATLVLATGATSTVAGEYRDPTGFSFVYPEGWFVVPNLQDVTKDKSLPPGIRNWLEKHPIDLNKARLLLVRNADDEFLQNLNVVVVDQQQPVNDTLLKQNLKLFPQQFTSMGLNVNDLQGRLQKVGINEALVFDYRFIVPGTETEVKQRQVHIPGGGKTFIVTCTWKADTSADSLQPFENMLASFNVPAPIARRFDMTSVLRGAIIGAVIGALIVLFRTIAGSRAKKA